MTKQKKLEIDLRKQIHKLELVNAHLERENKSLQQQLRLSKRMNQLMHEKVIESQKEE